MEGFDAPLVEPVVLDLLAVSKLAAKVKVPHFQSAFPVADAPVGSAATLRLGDDKGGLGGAVLLSTDTWRICGTWRNGSTWLLETLALGCSRASKEA